MLRYTRLCRSGTYHCNVHRPRLGELRTKPYYRSWQSSAVEVARWGKFFIYKYSFGLPSQHHVSTSSYGVSCTWIWRHWIPHVSEHGLPDLLIEAPPVLPSSGEKSGAACRLERCAVRIAKAHTQSAWLGRGVAWCWESRFWGEWKATHKIVQKICQVVVLMCLAHVLSWLCRVHPCWVMPACANLLTRFASLHQLNVTNRQMALTGMCVKKHETTEYCLANYWAVA